MNRNSITKINILNSLSLIPPNMLTELYKYLEFMNYKKNIKQKELSLQGIWKGKGFEKIDVEKEIYKLRANVSQKLEKIKL